DSRGLRGKATKFFSTLSDFSVNHPWFALLFLALILVIALPGLPRLRLRTDGQALLKRTAPEALYDDAIRAKFGLEDQIVVLIESTETNGIFTPETIQLVRELTTNLSNMTGMA